MQNNSESQGAGKYSQLDQQKGEIRVLILQPGGESDELHCTLETYQLESCREFDALSYAWGDPKPVEPIFVDGSRTLIAHNLSVALRHLRYPHSSRVLWIDAVCINQADVDERSHQVFMMNRVYTTANQVLIWLGEARGDSDFAITRLKELAGGQRATAAEKLRLGGLFQDCLMDRDWWGRLWIVQEVVLAKSDPIIICGHSYVSWNTFQKAIDVGGLGFLLQGELWAKERLERSNHRISLRLLREEYQNSKISDEPTPSLYTLLFLTKSFQSTDPRDKIYGCLGLLSMRDREIMKPDYQKPTELVFLAFAKYLLTRSEWGLYSGFSVSTRGKLSMTASSWLPNFAEQSGLSPTNPVMLFLSHSHKVDCGRRNVSFQDRERILAVTGLVLDTVEIAVELKSDPDLLLDQIAELELLAKQAVRRELPLDDAHNCFMNLTRDRDVFQVFPSQVSNSPLALREQYEALTRRVERWSGKDTTSQYERPFFNIIKHLLSGMHFFVANMGFFGMTGASVCKGDMSHSCLERSCLLYCALKVHYIPCSVQQMFLVSWMAR